MIIMRAENKKLVCWAVLCLVAQSCPTLCYPIDCSLTGFSVHGDSPGKMLEWIVMPSSRGSFQPRDWIQVSCIADRFFTIWVTREAQEISVGNDWKKKKRPVWFLCPIQLRYLTFSDRDYSGQHFCSTILKL